MQTHVKTGFLLYTFTLFMCLSFLFLTESAAQLDNQPTSNYTFETIDVEGVDFLAVTASNDSEDYAGYTKSADGEKEVAFTLIDGVFTTYDYPGSLHTHFYALSNDGQAAGHYQDSEGLYHGVILENGELRQYDFPNAVQTEIYDIGDATGALTGNFIDASGVRRGFSGDLIIEVPGATATYANFENTQGVIGGSYVDADGIDRPYVLLTPDYFITAEFSIDIEPSGIANLESFSLHGFTEATVAIARAKAVGDVTRTYIGPLGVLHEVRFPDAVSTEGWHINRDDSFVGYYDTADGRRHGFIARPATAPVAPADDFNYSYESIDVEGVDFLAVTASSDFEDYAGYTKSADGEKEVAFTLIDGVFNTYEFLDSQKTHFYALGNDGTAAGHYEDSDGLYHGVILENGELRQYDFPNAVQTEIYGISDATGELTGNFIDASGVRRGFSGDLIIEVPGATATYADFVNAQGVIVGSYVDADGIYHAYIRIPNGDLVTLPTFLPSLEYVFIHGINDAGVIVFRAKAVGDVPLTAVGSFTEQTELKFPGSVSTEGWNINQDGSVVGHYDSADGRRHGFIAKPITEPITEPEADPLTNAYHVTLAKGLNMISVPLAPPTPMTAKTLASLTGATTVITLDTERQEFVGWTPDAPDDGFAIEGAKGYIVNVPQSRQITFGGEAWTNQRESAAAPAISVETTKKAWAFVVSGHLAGNQGFDGYQVIVRNVRTDSTITASVKGDYFAAATADLARRSVVQVGDVIAVDVVGPGGTVESHTERYRVTPKDLASAVLSIRLDSIGQPRLTQLLQNFPNPFNPETWIPYHIAHDADVQLTIYDTKGEMVRQLDLGHQQPGYYTDRTKAAYWDGRNQLGEIVGSGVYFYHLSAGDYSATRKLVILK